MIKTPPPKPAPVVGWKQVPGGKIFTGDCIDMLKEVQSDSVDLVISDPAYESLEKHRAVGSKTRLKHSKASSNDWFQTFPNDRYGQLFQQLYRVMKPGTHLYLFCDEETRDVVTCGWSPQTPEVSLGYSPLIQAGFKYWKALIWDKVVAGMGYHFRAQHEFIIMAEKVIRVNKHRQLNDLGPGDVLRYQRLKGVKFYPTEKPSELISLLVLQSSNEGDTVLDIFGGSGVVGQMCRDHKRRFLLGDIDTREIRRRLT
jgi:site-specific DNA-methyltransferase (adenine-specific)